MSISPAVPGTLFCFAAVSPCFIGALFASLLDCLTHDTHIPYLDGAAHFRTRSFINCMNISDTPFSFFHQISVSVPVWEKISFLDASIAGKVVRLGVWGYTGSARKLGYSVNESIGLK
jgi:hypothetical protein